MRHFVRIQAYYSIYCESEQIAPSFLRFQLGEVLHKCHKMYRTARLRAQDYVPKLLSIFLKVVKRTDRNQRH